MIQQYSNLKISGLLVRSKDVKLKSDLKLEFDLTKQENNNMRFKLPDLFLIAALLN